MNFDDLDSEDSIDNITLNLNEIKSKITTYSSRKLCEMIACDRYLGLDPELVVICMEELARRRVEGDNFEFELYIESALKELPVLDFSMMDIRTVLNQTIGRKFYK